MHIFFKNMKGRGIISLCDTDCPLVPPNFVLFQAYFQQKMLFKKFQLNRAKLTHFTETTVLKHLCLIIRLIKAKLPH